MRWIFVPLIILMLCKPIYGQPEVKLGGGLNETEFGELDELSADKYNINFKELVQQAADGSLFEGDKIVDIIVSLVLKEIRGSRDVVKSVMFVCVLNGIIMAMTKGIGNNETERLATFAAFAAVSGLLCTGLRLCTDVLSEGAENITELIRASTPVIVALTAVGNGGAMGFGALLSFSSGILNTLIKNLVLPQIVFFVMLGMLNCFCDRPMVGKLSELFSLTASWSLKICAFIFAGCLTLCKMGTGVAALGGKSIKLAASSVPVVGNLFESSLETVAALTNALKGSVGAAIIILLVVMSAAHLIRLTVVMLMYKLTAGFAEPLGNNRITEMIDVVAEGVKLTIGAYFTVIVMFVTTVAITLGSM